MSESRIEKDSMGEVKVPAQAYYGAQTQRAVANFPTDSSKYLVINSITTTKRDDFLTYSIISNSNPTLVGAVLTNEQLTLTKVTGTGSATITVQAIDRFGASVTQSFTVTVS